MNLSSRAGPLLEGSYGVFMNEAQLREPDGGVYSLVSLPPGTSCWGMEMSLERVEK